MTKTVNTNPYQSPASKVRDTGIIYVDANLWRRFFNFAIDHALLYIFLVLLPEIFWFVFSEVDQIFFWSYAQFSDTFGWSFQEFAQDHPGYWIPPYLMYFILFEHFKGRTPGKFLTDTHVVDQSGNQPKFTTTVIRAFIRLIPIEFVSILFSAQRRCWHDILSKTHVVQST